MRAVGGHGLKIRRWDEAVAALLSCATIREAAKVAQIGENTLLRLMQNPEFAVLYKKARQDVLSAAMSRLQAISCEAVETLRIVMADKESPSSSRVSAARCVLEMTAKFVENEEILVRLETLESARESGSA